MNKIVWSNEFSVGIETIDLQHQKLFRIFNELLEIDTRDQDSLLRLIDSLVEYAVTHFKYEESLFDRYSFERKDEHKMKHQDFLKELFLVKKNCLNGQSIDWSELFDFLVEWIFSHIKEEDKLYADLFINNGEI